MWLGEDIFLHSPIQTALDEIHILAYFYHWNRTDCFNTPVTERGVFVDRIVKQIKLENNSGKNS